MGKINWNLIIDLAVLLVGVYILVSAICMKYHGKVGSLIASETELKKCKNLQGMVDAIRTEMIVFGIIIIVYAIFSFLCNTVIKVPFIFKSGILLLFLLICVIFVRKLTQVRKEFLK